MDGIAVVTAERDYAATTARAGSPPDKPTASPGNGYLVSLASALEHPIGAIADREKRKACRSEGAGGIVIAIAVRIASGRWR